MKFYLEFANRNAKSDEEKNEVAYYTVYLRKLSAVQSGKFIIS